MDELDFHIVYFLVPLALVLSVIPGIEPAWVIVLLFLIPQPIIFTKIHDYSKSNRNYWSYLAGNEFFVIILLVVYWSVNS